MTERTQLISRTVANVTSALKNYEPLPPAIKVLSERTLKFGHNFSCICWLLAEAKTHANGKLLLMEALKAVLTAPPPALLAALHSQAQALQLTNCVFLF